MAHFIGMFVLFGRFMPSLPSIAVMRVIKLRARAESANVSASLFLNRLNQLSSIASYKVIGYS